MGGNELFIVFVRCLDFVLKLTDEQREKLGAIVQGCNGDASRFRAYMAKHPEAEQALNDMGITVVPQGKPQ